MSNRTTQAEQKSLAARRVALDLVLDVQSGLLLPESTADLARLSPADRARAQRLAMTVLRWSDRVDRMLGPFLRLKPYPAVLNILRLGVVEMCVDDAAPHGVVNALVNLARLSPETTRSAGLVNAVLRRVADAAERWGDLPVPRLPKKLRAPMVKAYGKAGVEAIEAAHIAPVPLDLTSRGPDPLDPSRFADHDARLLPTGSLRLWRAGQVSALPGYDDGLWWVQDAAAALPAQMLDVQPGERVLDLCAAPGGKTAQMAAAGAQVTALDLSERRMARLMENLQRLRLSADCVVADALTYDAKPFDAVLLDAPCSATGTIRRHPDLPIAKAKTDFSDLITLQAKMLDAAWRLVRPGGRMVYCTCSLLPDEGEHQIEAAAARHPDLSVQQVTLPYIEPVWISPLGLRLRPDFWPDHGGMDGFFAALLQKSAGSAIPQ